MLGRGWGRGSGPACCSQGVDEECADRAEGGNRPGALEEDVPLDRGSPSVAKLLALFIT